jgi:hypothetical protein
MCIRERLAIGVLANHRLQQSGTEFARTKENVAEIMRAKQAAGKFLMSHFESPGLKTTMQYSRDCDADSLCS